MQFTILPYRSETPAGTLDDKRKRPETAEQNSSPVSVLCEKYFPNSENRPKNPLDNVQLNVIMTFS